MYQQYGDEYEYNYFAKDLYVEYSEVEEDFRLNNHSTTKDRFEVSLIRKYGYTDDLFGNYHPGIFDSNPPTIYIKSRISNIVIPKDTYIEFEFKSKESDLLFPISYTVDSISSDIELSIGGERYMWTYDNPIKEEYDTTNNPVIKTTKEIQGIDIIKNLQFEFDETVYNPKNFSINFGS